MGFRPASCEEAGANAAAVLAQALVRDVCAVGGGTVRGPTTQFGSAFQGSGPELARIVCPDDPPEYASCIIATNAPGSGNGGSLPPPPPPSPPPPPPPAVTLLIVRSTSPIFQDLEPIPAGFRELTCGEVAEHRDAIRELLPRGEPCGVVGGAVLAGTAPGDEYACVAGLGEDDQQLPLSCIVVVDTAAPPSPPPPPPQPSPPSPPAVVPVVGSAVVKAWKVGRGTVLFLGAGIVPEDQIFGDSDEDVRDRAVWRQCIRSMVNIPAGEVVTF
eukprot:359593-Chlamydomonas_euryale.AAC.6